ncbi:energy-coupling factor ABC transporter permease [bacterium]|nr:energy-coupling factor ABC transporter permease [bacterium]
MHLPDGFVSAPVAGATTALALIACAVSIRKTRKTLDTKTVPLLGVTAAFIFSAQMINFPVAAGTSGHVLGAALAVALLGPYSGLLVMTVTLVLQALLFADGGITALGANLVNMGLVGGGVAWLVLQSARTMRLPARFLPLAGGVAAWLSLVTASATCAAILSFSGIVPAKLVFPAMIGVHAIIGLGEGIVTASALSLILAWRPDLLNVAPQSALYRGRLA